MDRADGRLVADRTRNRPTSTGSTDLDAGPMTVLCVDADRRAAARRAADLERWDGRLSASAATDRRAVLDRVASGAVECIVCARELTDVDGLALLASVRDRDGRLPFVFVTDASDEAFVREVLSAAGTDHVRLGEGTSDEVLGSRVRNAVTRYRAQANVSELERGLALRERLTRRLLRTTIDAELAPVTRDGAEVAAAVREAFDGYDPVTRVELARYDDGTGSLSLLAASDGGDHILERVHDDPDREAIAAAIRDGEPQVVSEADFLEDEECLTLLAVALDGDRHLLFAAVAEACAAEKPDRLTGIAAEVAHAVNARRLQSDLKRFRNAVEHAGHVVLITDETGTIEYVNPAFETVTGYDREEAIGRTPAMLSSGEHDEPFYADLWETIRSGEVWRGEVINRRAGGDRYVIDQTIAPIEHADGEVVGYVGINRNVTDRKERERDLAFLKRAVDQAGVGIGTCGADGRSTYVNRRLAELVGTDREDLEGRHVAEINVEFDRDRFDDYWNSFAAGETRIHETTYERLDTGEEIPVEVVSSRIVVDDEPYQISTARDVADRKRYERDLQRFRSAVEHAGHGVVITDEAGTIEYVNEAFEGMSGYSAAEAVGETPAILNSGVHDDAFFADLWETILAGEVWRGEVVNERADGTRYVVDQTIAPIREDDASVGFVAINNDISDLKAYERELESQNERLAQYGRMVAHDLRNPLTLLDAHVEAIETTLEADPETPFGDLEPALRREFQDVAELSAYMSRLVENLLSMAEQGQFVLDAEATSLATTAQTAWREVGTATARLVVDDATIEADPERLRELLSNLFRNAVEHAGPDVAVRVGPLSFADGFFVEDDGPGIPEDERDQVLERGYTTANDGTGFGLAIVSQIAAAHEWAVVVAESADGGARFEFRT